MPRKRAIVVRARECRRSDAGARNLALWGGNALKSADVLNQHYSPLTLNMIDFLVESPENAEVKLVCACMPTGRHAKSRQRLQRAAIRSRDKDSRHPMALPAKAP